MGEDGRKMANVNILEKKNGKKTECKPTDSKKLIDRLPLVEPKPRATLPDLDKLEKKLETTIADAEEIEQDIKTIFHNLSSEEKERWLRNRYDSFSDEYDNYMEKTGHYRAIKKAIAGSVAGTDQGLIRFPILDLSVGTGMVLEYFLKAINKIYKKRGALHFVDKIRKPKKNELLVWANDLSPKMIEKAEERLKKLELKIIPQPSNNLIFTSISFRDYPHEHSELKNKFGTVFISQTFHVTPEKDALVKAIDWALAPGGVVVIVEEFQWRTSVHSNLCLRLIEAIATPLPHKADLIALFNKGGDTQLTYTKEARITIRIDHPTHEMSGFVLKKPGHKQESERVSIFSSLESVQKDY